MDKKNIKSQVISGMFWKFAERFSAQFVTLIVSIVLARILDPDHYGAVAIIMVFINIANVFVTESFSAALIQKKDANNVDFSTIFYFNIVFSVALYLIVYVSAPFIAEFYNMPELCNAMRILGVKLLISAVYSVQQANVSKNMLFKKFFYATISGTVFSAIVGIAMAYMGFGIYAIVGQYLTNSITGAVVLWFAVKWRPILVFSFKKFKGLFSYGWKVLVSALIRTLYEDIYSLVIGKKYTSEDLAFYTKGKHYPNLIINNVNTTIISVLFPALSKYQEDREKIKFMMRRAIKISSYILSPIMIGMAVVAEPLVSLVLTDKWLPCVPYLRISCFALLLMPMQSANLQVIKAVGRSDLILKLEIIKRIAGIVVLVATMHFGVLAIAYGLLAVTLFASLVNSFPNKKILGYSYFQQISDILQNAVLGSISCIPVYFLQYLNIHNNVILAMQVVAAAVIYVALSALTKNEEYQYLLNEIKSKLGTKKPV